MTEPKTVTPADNLAELKHLLGLVDIEMQILGDSTGRMAHWLGRDTPLKFARETLPWKRGKTVVADAMKLSQHLARVAELLPLVESEQEAAASPEGKQADSAEQK